MKLPLKKINGIVGIVQLLINLVFIIPETLYILDSGGGGFGYGILLLSVTIPLTCMAVFAFFGFFNYERHFRKVKKLLITAYILAIIICVLSFLWIPMVPFSLLGLPLFIVLSLRIKKKNIGKRIVLTNGIILICQGILLLIVLR